MNERVNAHSNPMIGSAEALAQALGSARWTGHEWQALCPAHEDHHPSLSITQKLDGRIVFVCRSQGCSQGEIIAGLKARGLWPFAKTSRCATAFGSERARHQHEDEDASRRTSSALALWRGSLDAGGSLVETYLKSRGITCPPPPTLRFHPALRHSPSGLSWPAMVALVTHGVGKIPLGIHRTFLARDGSGKAAVENEKMMLGPARGGAVKLAAPGALLHVGEGIETCLSALQQTGTPTWAALSTSGLRALDLPPTVREVVILADGDEAGEKAAQDSALRWKREGRRVRIARPPRGSDFNDLLLNAAAGKESRLDQR
jgi:hypothetical protein